MDKNNLNVEDLTNYCERKNIKRREKYVKILKLCHNKIKIATKVKSFSCWFIIPLSFDGIPLTENLKECVKFILDKLNEGGFKVKLYEPNILYISWKI